MADQGDRGRGDATEATRTANEELAAKLAFEDKRDFEEAERGLIAPLPDGGRVHGADGGLVWDLSRFEFIHEHEEAPSTVNPSLWRQMRLTVQGGLYEVVPGLYQVRTLDLSNITFAEGEDGLIAFDPLISAETARAALDLYYEHRPRKPVAAVVYSHSHVDHFGGVPGIVDEGDVEAAR
jgi:alkyl sulfatase BDS1-like metallo-beta-lactamase superfamily hydrolase